MPRDHDDLGRRLDAPGRAHDGGAVDVGEIGVEQDEGEAGLAEQAQAVVPGRGDDDRISLTLEEVAQEERGFGVSIDDQDRVLLAHVLSLSPPGGQDTVLEEHEDQPRELHADEDDQPASRPSRTCVRYSTMAPRSVTAANAGELYAPSRPYVSARPPAKLQSAYAASHRATMETMTEPRVVDFPRSRASTTTTPPRTRSVPSVASARRVTRAHDAAAGAATESTARLRCRARSRQRVR